MTAIQITGLGVRLFAVWLFVYVVRNFPSIWFFNTQQGDASANLVVVMTMLVVFAVIGLLWFFPLSVASKLLPPTVSDNRVALPPEQVQAVGFSLLGLWVLVHAIPSALYWVFMSYHAAKPMSLTELRPDDYASISTTGLEIVLGVWLLFGAKGLRGLLRWARSVGS